ncbi:MAG: DUF721 domain-containing protein [Planctomycetales bacterium]|nr:DUF721 domain-containing protein [Planctomycetales bacterium]MCA9171559.1 DUF721 domain-containing protein [Planctomycetales bacterium]
MRYDKYNKRKRSDEEERKRREPRRMGDLLPMLMARRGYARMLAADQFADAWEQASGRMAGLSRAGNVRRGVLEIFVKNSLVLQELTFQKQQLLRTMQELLPDQSIRDLRFSVGHLE